MTKPYREDDVRYLKILFACMLMVTLSACHRLSREDTNEWLAHKNGGVTVNMTGKWNSGGVWSGGWGGAVFVQEGNRFNGTMGLYYVDGAVSGDNLYLVLYSGRKVYYTARLKKNGDDSYIGKAVYQQFVDRPGAESAETAVMSLKRVQ